MNRVKTVKYLLFKKSFSNENNEQVFCQLLSGIRFNQTPDSKDSKLLPN